MAIRLDYTNMLGDVVAGGVSLADWDAAGRDFPAARARVAALAARGVLGFLELPGDTRLAGSVTTFARKVAGKFDDIVVLGIGGSALGPIAIRTALLAPNWNALSAAERQGQPRLHVLDNVDPRTIDALLNRLDLARALFVVTSKSGGTAETMAQYLVVRARLDAALGARATDHLVFITDPTSGALRPLSVKEKIAALDIPSAVGGRYSVLTPVGTLPAALVGVDIAAMLAGAADMAQRCASESLAGNPAAIYATLQHAADVKRGRHIHVFMPYSDPLRDMADWFVQLWAESLGKHRKSGDPGFGPTPVAALGATDQHSQVQLFMEGPPDKTVTFLTVASGSRDVTIPSLHADVRELAYLGGHKLGELLDVEQRATAGALARRGRPNMTLRLDAVDAWHLGALFMFLECATIHAAMLYDVDPLNQPGVELGKNFTYAMLGRPGSEEARREWDLLPKPNPARVV
ncbi:MAG TPA: glucose-6-phosphate isomerase [Gemmatimonadaceae bacterium]|nr:glucose-6-phosphate isomerase [Gemmatimonadaceae bacterium]